jgi:lysophospholipase L1-like esterase
MTMHSPILRIGWSFLTIAAGCDKLGFGNSPTAPSGPPTPGSAISCAAVGASDALGIGASVECLPYVDCPNGTGYVPDAARQLAGHGFSLTLTNLGVPTAAIGPGFQSLGRQDGRTIVGNFIEMEMPFVPRTATLVTIFAGGNEVNTITAALGGGAGSSDQTDYIDQQVRAFGADFATLLGGIRDRAGAPRIIVLNVPNLAGLPFLAGASLPQRQAAQRAAVGMTTTVVYPLTWQNIAVSDLMCDSRAYAAPNYSSDGFHPNDAGHAFIDSEIVRAVTSSSYPAPASSCAQMTSVP